MTHKPLELCMDFVPLLAFASAAFDARPPSSHSILNNRLGDSADTLVAAARELPQLVTLCGIQPEQEAVDFSGRRLDAGDAKLLAFDLSKNQTIKTLNLNNNQLAGDRYSPDMSGILKLAEALPHSQLTSLRWPTSPMNFAWT